MLPGVFEVEKEDGSVGQPSVRCAIDILDYRRTDRLSIYKSHVQNELEDNVRKNAFTRTSCEHASTLARARAKSTGRCTFSVDPDQRSGLFPVLEGSTFDEPHASTLMMSIAGSVVIDEWIRGGEPPHEVVQQLFSCKIC